MVSATQEAPAVPNLPEAGHRAGEGNHRGAGGPAGGRGRSPLRALILVALLAGAAGAAYAVLGEAGLRRAYQYARARASGGATPGAPGPRPAPTPPRPWDGSVRMTGEEQEAIGIQVIPVRALVEPIRLELNGRTDYDQTTLTKIRPRFDNALIQKVFVSTGQAVKHGEPLLEIYSADLASAKNDCRTKFVQWDHDRKFLVSREPLFRQGGITQVVWTDTQNNEKKSRLDYSVARDRLVTYGMTREEIDALLAGLGDDKKLATPDTEESHDISRMVVASPIDGVVVERDVVPGNMYDVKDNLLTISPMDQLWVWGNVFECDQGKVQLGQTWEIQFPFLAEKVQGKVESISNRVDPATHTVRIRATVPNPGKRLKSDMLVRSILQIPPAEGDAVIPRIAMAVINGEYFAFVRKAGDGRGDLFERRKLEVKQEASDRVVVRGGLQVGDQVVAAGSLILAQMYEDQSTNATGMPPH